MVADIIKASNTLCAWLSGISQILITSNTSQHFDVLGICISISVHTIKVGVCACVHIGVGFGVACSDVKAKREPQIAEQQQCSPAFFVQMQRVCIESGAAFKLTTAFFVCVFKNQQT